MASSNVLNKQKIWERAPHYREVRHIVFTDHPAPTSAKTYDVSEAQDNGIVRWQNGDTCYFSTQRSGVKAVAPVYCVALFFGLYKLKTFDGTMLDTSHVIRMYEMFARCGSLESVNGLSGWNVSKVTDMDYMFADCISLRTLDGLRDWNVGNVSTMLHMFSRCKSLESTNGLSNWDVSNVRGMANMFEYCILLHNLDGLKHWNTNHVITMTEMFKNCESLKNVDGLANWDVHNVKGMEEMFFGCSDQITKPSWYHDD